MFVHMRIKRRGGGGKENRYSAPSSSRFDRNNDLTNRNEVCFHFDVLVFSIITFFILCLSFSFTNNNNDDDDETDRHTHTHTDTHVVVFPFHLLVCFVHLLTMHKTMKLINSMNLVKDLSHSFARGFDDFDVTWPPSTSITSINDDK